MKTMQRQPRTWRVRVRRLLVGAAAIGIAFAAQTVGLQPAVSQVPAVTAYATTDNPGLDPFGGPWNRVQAAKVPMTAQNQQYPKGGGAVPVVDVRALQDGANLYVRLEWADSSPSDSSYGTDRFSDAAAIQFPGKTGSSSPAYCMGQADGGVNIWQWRADGQAGVPQTLHEEDPNGYVDLYPDLPDGLDYPARALGNTYAVNPDQPVRDLVAQGFGTIGPAQSQQVSGQGAYEGDRWAVVFSRPFASGAEGQPSFRIGDKTDVVVAAWDGANGDRNGQKSVSQFFGMTISEEKLPADRTWIIFALMAGVLSVGLVMGVVYWRTGG